MKFRLICGLQDESGFSLISTPQNCGSKAKQGGLLEAGHRYVGGKRKGKAKPS